MTWTGPQEDLLRKLVGEGLSAGEIALRMPGKSRNAVLGKAWRLGLMGAERPRRVTTKRKRRSPRRKPEARKEFVLFNTLGFIDKNSRVKKVHLVQDGYVPKPEEPAPEGQRKSLLELEEHHCRWPINDPLGPDFHFCGAEANVGSVYCPTHHARAYVTPVLKQRVPEQEVVRETEDA
jgi:GcrA cell cycle regulator